MKRGAERQIQREDGENPHEADGGAGNDGQSGSEAEGRKIASRPIRGLPKKKASETPTSLFAQTPTTSPFSFSGFGTSQTSTPSAPANSLFSGFGTSSTGNASSNSTSSMSPAAAPFTFSTPSSNGKTKTDSDLVEVDYFCTLRGLNMSLKSQLAEAIAKEIDTDPFTDLSKVLKAVQTKYEDFREKAEEKRRNATSSKVPSSVPNTTSTFTPSTAATTPSVPVISVKSAAVAASTPSFSLPKAPANEGFSFAGTSFSSNTTSKAASSPSLLPGQPTFSLPSTGFYSSFGKNDDDDVVEEEEEEHEDVTAARIAQEKESESKKESKSTETVPAAASPFTSNTSATPAAAPTSFSSTPFSFGSAPALPSSPVANTAASNAYRFSFGGSRSDDADNAKDQDTQTPSLFSSTLSAKTPSMTPTIGSNFANTSGVKQAGAFSFGSGSINFGSSPPTFGSAVGSTGFTFGSSHTKDTSKKSDDSKDTS